MTKYIAYCRKSTDEPDRQILSIEAQVAELEEFATKESLKIVSLITESKTAKEPGREKFAQVLEMIESGQAAGIISWHPDRLARNSVDGGKIIYLLDTGKLHDLKFPSFWFENTPQGKFMLSIAFGQSKYYVDNLSENVKRGNRQKLRRGEWPNQAPFGYLNINKKIEVDKKRAKYVQKAFQLFATGGYGYADIRKFFNQNKIYNKSGHELHLDKVKRFLTDPFYYGVMKFCGELYEGKHPPLISKKLFDKCQEVMMKKSKPKTPKLKPYVYRGLFRCGECGCFITTETQKGHNYLRCTKRKVRCSQKYTREEIITSQAKEKIKKVSLSSAWANTSINYFENEKMKIAQAENSFAQKLRDELVEIETKLDRLLDLQLDGSLSQTEYTAKKQKLILAKKDLEEKIHAFGRKSNNRFELAINFIKEANQAEKYAQQENPERIRDFLKKIGSNFRIADRTLVLDFKNAFKIAEKYHAEALCAEATSCDFAKSENWRRGWDSNPREGCPSNTLAGCPFQPLRHLSIYN